MRLLNKEKLKDNIEKIARYDLDNNNLFGSAYYVWQNGDVVYKNNFGDAKIDTIYRLASMTKPVTAIAILILVDRGLISLNDPVSKFLPQFRNIHIVTLEGVDLGETKTEVTILHCLTHTSGFGSERQINLSDNERATKENTLKRYIDAGLEFEPFTKQAYSGCAAFDVLAAIVEKVTGISYDEFLKKEIFEPCGMKDTTFSPSEEQWERFITLHDKKDGRSIVGESTEGCVFINFPCGHKPAGAGLASTLDDYAKFSKMLLNKGKTPNGRILSEDIFNKISVPYVPESIMPGNVSWGLGVRVIRDESYKILPGGTFGWSGYYGSHFWIDPENKICAVFMKNSLVDGGAENNSAVRFENAVFEALEK